MESDLMMISPGGGSRAFVNTRAAGRPGAVELVGTPVECAAGAIEHGFTTSRVGPNHLLSLCPLSCLCAYHGTK